MMILNKNIFFLILLLFFSLSCEKIPNNGIPSYIKLVKPTIQNNSPTQGSSKNQFSDLWIESNSLSLGAYEIPTILPLFLEGENEIIVNPGVKLNGSAFNRIIYPIFEPFTATYNFVQKDTTEITPVFKYRQGVTFLYNDNFENNNNFSNLQRTSITDVNNIEGKSGKLTLLNNEKTKKATTINPIVINDGKRVYVEMSLKSDSYVGVGFSSIYDVNKFIEIAIFQPNSEWNTTYFEITSFINKVKEGQYNFYINAQKDSEGEEENTYFDNFKIIQF